MYIFADHGKKNTKYNVPFSALYIFISYLRYEILIGYLTYYGDWSKPAKS